MTTFPKAERDELRRLHDAATPAPWCGDWDISNDVGDPIATTDVSLASDPAVADNDGPLIVAARNALPRLLDALDAAEAERDAERKMIVDAKAAAINAFVQGADWLRFKLTEATSFESERDEAAKVAEERFPFIPRVHLEMLREAEAERDQLRAELAEVKGKLDDREGDMHSRIRAGYDKTVADSWRNKVAEVERERDDAKTKLAALSSYAGHRGTCGTVRDRNNPGRQRSACTCGMVEAVAAAKAGGGA